MPGMPSHFKILERTISRMTGQADLDPIRQVLQDNPEWAALGAFGPALADFIPGTRGQNPYLNVWAEVFSLIGDGMRVDKGLLTIIREIRETLDQLDPILAAEDLSALQALGEDTLNVVENAGADLGKIFDQIPFIVLPIGTGIVSQMRPGVDVPVGDPVPPNEFWELRNYLFWKKSGRFATNLLAKMSGSGDSRFIAYAYGYIVSYAANVVGSPFVASTVRGTYRTHWWRHRWVNNYVDSWVWGNYEAGASMAGDTPAPPYDQWPSLCSADLHERIALGDHDVNDLMVRLYNNEALSDEPTLPVKFGELWVEAFNETYNPGSTIGGLTPARLNDAYLMTWLVLWFQTGSDGLGCNVAPSMTPPSGCGDQPPWVEPEVSDEGGTPTVPTPEAPEIESDPDVADIVSGILLALLGLGFIATGNLDAGGHLFKDGIEKIIEGASDINWGTLRCYLYWYRLYLYNARRALDEILTAAAFRYPDAGDLANDQTMPQYFSAYLDPYDSGKNLTKSHVCVLPDCRHPSKPWVGGFDWLNAPTTFESPDATAYRVSAYPSFFVDDAAANPLGNGEIRIAGVWPIRMESMPGAKPVAVQFGNSVDNSIDVFRHLDQTLPDWNLDADRGLAYQTWEFLNGIYLDPVAIQPEP